MTTAMLKARLSVEEGVDSASLEEALQPEYGLEIVNDAAWPADLVVVGCGSDSDRATELVREAVDGRPDRPIIVVAPQPPNGLMERLFAEGADDIVVLPEEPGRIAFAIQKAVARKHGALGMRSGQVVTVMGPKGGTGKTFVAANLGVALAKAGHRTTVVDLDLQFGDLALALGLRPRRTLYDLARTGGDVDPEKLAGFTTPHRSGLRALLAPLRPDEAASVDADLLTDVFGALREADEWIVLDTPAGFPQEVIAAIDAASEIVLVGTLDAGSLKDSKLGLETVALMGHDPAEVILVLNRAGTKAGIDMRDVEEILGRAPDILVPSDREVVRSINEGKPIVESRRRSGAARSVTALAQLLVSREAASPVSGLERTLRRAG